MSIQAKRTVKLPRFKSEDKGLESALNTLAQAIEDLPIPYVSMPVGGTTEWNGEEVIIRPDVILKDTLPPFWPVLFQEGTTYKISLLRGVVILRDKRADVADGVRYHDPSNRLDNNKYPVKFKIKVGQALYVTVTDTTEEDFTEGSIKVEVADKGLVSPNKSSSSTAAGVMHYKIAELVDEDGVSPKLKRYVAGDNIWHDLDKDEEVTPETGTTGRFRVLDYTTQEHYTVMEWSDGKITTQGDVLLTMFTGVMGVSVTPL